MNQVKAEILTIGDEILYGQIVDTNSQWMSAELSDAGIKTIRKTTVGDVVEDIISAFEDAEQRADIVLITGGLGPTKDDLTKPLLAQHFNVPLEMNQEALDEVTEFFESRGRELTDLNRKQAELPRGSRKITNRMGTAPGMWLERNGCVFVSMPGVPVEMKTMMTEFIMPDLKDRFNTSVIYHKIIRTAGIGESFLSEEISEWEDNLPENIKLAYLPSLAQVRLRLTAAGEDHSFLESQVAKEIEKLKPMAGKYIFGYDQTELQDAIGQLLIDNNLNLATAESCTGGYLAHLITQVPGSSDYYLGTVVSYSNDVKISQLGVKQTTLESKGAVSEETAMEMAQGVRKHLNASIGLSTTGIAGPGGGSKEKPVGTVWIGYSDDSNTIARKLQLSSDRLLNIKLTANIILNLLRIQILRRTKK